MSTLPFPESGRSTSSLTEVLALRLWLGGRVLLVAALALGLAATFAAAYLAPRALVVIPVGVLALAGGFVLLRSLRWAAAGAVVLSLLLSGVAEPIPAGKLIFGVYVAALMVMWYTAQWATGKRIVTSWTDGGAALLLILGTLGGVGVGLVLQNKPIDIFGHFRAFLPALLYFPLKHVCEREKSGPEIIAGAIIVVGIGAAIQNAILTREAFESATYLWQIIDVRVAYGEMMLLASSLLAIGFLLSSRRHAERLLFIVLFGIILAGLIITKSRGFWVSTLLGGFVLVLVSDHKQRRKMLLAATLGVLALAVLAFAFAADYVLLIGAGIVKRFSTISTAATADVSLVNRFAENAGAWESIRRNPIMGYGWGATFTYYSLISAGTQNWGFVHNAYLGLWLKIGLWGLLLVVWVWTGAAFSGLRAMRDRRLSARHRALAGAAGAGLVGVALAANTSSPIELADQMLVLTALWALAQGTAQRAATAVE